MDELTEQKMRCMGKYRHWSDERMQLITVGKIENGSVWIGGAIRPKERG